MQGNSMIDQFDGDVAFVLTQDGGQIFYTGGQPFMDVGGLENAVTISLFTGLGWWGNALEENEPDKQIGSDFEDRTINKAITVAYLRDIEDAARDALQWMISQKIAKAVKAVATWPDLNRVDLEILITKPDGDTVPIRYALNWEAGLLYPVTATTGISQDKTTKSLFYLSYQDVVAYSDILDYSLITTS